MSVSLADLTSLRVSDVVVRQTESKGRGVFANRNFAVGELVSEERATLLLDNSAYQAAQTNETFPKSLDDFFENLEWPKVLDELHCFVGPKSKREYLAVCSAETFRKVGILEANQFDFGSLDAIGLAAFSAMYNHSCFPNLVFSSDGDILRMFAKTRILEGDELCIQYCPTLRTRKDRREWMRDAYGFECACCLCSFQGGDVMRRFACEHCKEGSFLAEGPGTCVSCQSHSSVDLAVQTESDLMELVSDSVFFPVFLDSRATRVLHRGHILMRKVAEDCASFCRGLSVAELPRLRKALRKDQKQSELGLRFCRAASRMDLLDASCYFDRMAVDQIRSFYEFMSGHLNKKYYSPELASCLFLLGQDFLMLSELSSDQLMHSSFLQEAGSCFKEAKLLTRLTHGSRNPKYRLLEIVVTESPPSYSAFKVLSDRFFAGLAPEYDATRQIWKLT